MKFCISEKIKTVIGIAILVLAGVVLNYNNKNRLDVISDDDDLYYLLGTDFISGKPFNSNFGPIYSFWQMAIRFMTGDTISTFYWNWLLLTILPLIAIYCLMRSLEVNHLIALWLSLFTMYSSLNYDLVPKTTVFALMILGAGLAFAFSFKNILQYIAFITISTALTAYIRPEMYMVALLFTAYLLVKSIRTKNYSYILLVTGFMVILGLLFGTPIGKGDRSLWTFQNYFSINYLKWYPNLHLSPWNDFEQITTIAFGKKITSVFHAFSLKPDLVLKHIFENVQSFFWVTFKFMKEILWDSWAFMYRRYLALLVAIALFLSINFKATYTAIINHFKQNRLYWIVLIVLLSPTVLTNVLIFSSPRYMLFYLLLYLPFIGILLTHIRFKNSTSQRLSNVLIIINLIAVFCFLIPKLSVNAKNKPQQNLEIINNLKTLNLRDSVNIISFTQPLITYQRYFGKAWNAYCYDCIRPKVFSEFVRLNHINCIFINKNLKEYYEKDTTYKTFQKDPSSLGFERKIERQSYTIYLKRGTK